MFIKCCINNFVLFWVEHRSKTFVRNYTSFYGPIAGRAARRYLFRKTVLHITLYTTNPPGTCDSYFEIRDDVRGNGVLSVHVFSENSNDYIRCY
jgi:hypothetical protein